MTNQKIMKLAEDAGASMSIVFSPENLARFVELVAASEREACARVAEGKVNATPGSKTHIAAAIRSRGEK